MNIGKQIAFFEAFKERVNAAFEPGFSVAIVRGGEVEYALDHGLASIEHESPLTSDSLYYLASVSKQFTAASILDIRG